MKNYSDETLLEKLRSIEFPDYSNRTCVNNAYQDLLSIFSAAFDFVAPIRTSRVKSNNIPRFAIDVLNAISSRDKEYEKIKQ